MHPVGALPVRGGGGRWHRRRGGLPEGTRSGPLRDGPWWCCGQPRDGGHARAGLLESPADTPTYRLVADTVRFNRADADGDIGPTWRFGKCSGLALRREDLRVSAPEMDITDGPTVGPRPDWGPPCISATCGGGGRFDLSRKRGG